MTAPLRWEPRYWGEVSAGDVVMLPDGTRGLVLPGPTAYGAQRAAQRLDGTVWCDPRGWPEPWEQLPVLIREVDIDTAVENLERSGFEVDILSVTEES